MKNSTEKLAAMFPTEKGGYKVGEIIIDKLSNAKDTAEIIKIINDKTKKLYGAKWDVELKFPDGWIGQRSLNGISKRFLITNFLASQIALYTHLVELFESKHGIKTIIEDFDEDTMSLRVDSKDSVIAWRKFYKQVNKQKI